MCSNRDRGAVEVSFVSAMIAPLTSFGFGVRTAWRTLRLMLGWETKSEQGICLTCHRPIDFHWRVADDRSKLEAVAPTHVVDSEKDAKNPLVMWYTLQKK